MPRISNADYQRRMDNLQAKVAANELDLFLVSSRDNIYYLTGIVCEPLERPMFLLVRPTRAPVFLVPRLERDHIEESTGGGRVDAYLEYPAPPGQGWNDKLHEMLDKMLDGATRIGIEPSLRVEIADELSAYSPSTMPLVEELRVVKSTLEVEMIRRAAGYADLGISRLLASSYHGSTVAEGFAETRTVMKRIICETEGFNPLLTKVLMGTWAAPRSAKPHSIPKLADALLEGPHIGLVLTTVGGYAAECERTYFTVRPSTEMRSVFASMMEARRIAMEKIRPGVSCGEVDTVVKEFLGKEGYGDRLLHRTGHGIGIAYHAEAPWLADGCSDVLVPGMVISVEPGIYLRKVGGFRHSDTVAVTEGGSQCLTRSATGIDQLTITAWKPLTRLKGRLVRWSLGVKPKPVC